MLDPAQSPRAEDGREETPDEQFDRNWEEILQELRVTQTGTQIISGFLLTLAFQQRFKELTSFQIIVYLVLVLLAAAATAIGLAPVSLHRTLFRRHEKKRMVAIGNRLLKITLVVVALLTGGVVMFIFDVVGGILTGIVAGAAVFVLLALVLVVLPWSARRPITT
ncbi:MULTISPECIES: DUF6328 family protein [unclassified Cryobacterium]|jgi:hypothetical protein|uniref:DUF6328 family protein n=1 Tax=unclassified Cryobacterium TaxID=2649013 RepID=UPI000CE4D98C|nr:MULTISPECIES: DUF6328 family protein [unclassified Cryobacterium]